MVASSKRQFLPLLLIQLILIVLFLVMSEYEHPPPPAAPAPAGRAADVAEPFDKAEESLMDVHVMIFIGFGFLMTFLKRYGYSAVGYNLMLSALVVQWALFVQTAIFNFNVAKTMITIKYSALIEADIMTAAILISFGAVLGMTSPAQLIFMAFVETVVGCANLYLFTRVLKAEDIGGSIPIHTFGAYFGLGAGIGMNLRKLQKGAAGDPAAAAAGAGAGAGALTGSTYTSDLFAMLGSVFLFIYWPTFNSALASSAESHARANMNTYLSISASAVVAIAVSSLTDAHGRLDMVHVQNSVLAGGVAIGSVANVNTSPGAALLIGGLVGMFSVCGYRYLTPTLSRLGVVDTCGVHNLHGMPGVLAGMISVLMCVFSSSLGADKPYVYHETGRTDGQLALYQFLGLISTLAIGLVSGLVTGFLSTLILNSPKPEELYLDEVHWETPK